MAARHDDHGGGGLRRLERQEAAIGFRRVKAAAISMKPRKWDKAWNADQLEGYFRKAARKGAHLALAPEGIIEGYVVSDVIERPELAPRMFRTAEPLDGPTVRRFKALARELGICVALGLAERRGGNVYNCAVFIDHKGKLRGAHRKTQLYEGCHDSWYFNRLGKTLRAFDTPLGRVGFLICNERWNPAIARAIVLDGAQSLLIPSFGNRGKAQNAAVLARARENGVPVVEANVGVNLIVSKGEQVAYHWGTDHLTVADIDIPEPVSTRTARMAERVFLRLRPQRVAYCLESTIRSYGRGCLRPPPASAKTDRQ